MGFLDNAGLTYFYGKIKEKFASSVNGITPDSNGNIALTTVANATNATYAAELGTDSSLRTKLTGDVLTISQQTPALNATQMARVHTNLGIGYGSALPTTTGHVNGEIFFVAIPS